MRFYKKVSRRKFQFLMKILAKYFKKWLDTIDNLRNFIDKKVSKVYAAYDKCLENIWTITTETSFLFFL